MTYVQEQIKQIEARWEELVELRQQHYDLVLSKLERPLWFAAIERLNESTDYERHFDVMEAVLRDLDPDHQ